MSSPIFSHLTQQTVKNVIRLIVACCWQDVSSTKKKRICSIFITMDCIRMTNGGFIFMFKATTSSYILTKTKT